MSDWELVDNSQAQMQQPSSDWDLVETPVSQQKQSESFPESLVRAPFRIGEDVSRGIMQFAQNIPGYYEAAKTEIPGALNLAAPRAHRQFTAGLAELGHNLFNLPHDVINYLSSGRLNLVPENVNQVVQMARMPSDTQQMINQHFGVPSQPGEALVRGIGRNALNIGAATGIANKLNPINLRAKSIANDVLREESKQVASHTKRYNNIWKEAEKSGFNNVPVDTSRLINNLDVIKKYKTPREFKSLNEMIENPTLSNAQKAQSDMNIIHRKLEEKSRSSALNSEEKAIYNAAHDAEKHIESNMFKNARGDVNNKLQNKYKMLTTSYRENVVPYKYNPSIQAYKNKEMLPHELVNSLSRGEFAAKKGHKHRAIGLRKIAAPLLTGAGIGGGLFSAANLLMGNRQGEESQGNY